ncbi:MAG: DUF4434 domain-containing protein [Firmicutes bacterium]|nr:DUF4434 domain-containing protein [Bacillota bacterium]
MVINIPAWEQRYPYPTADGSFIQTWLVKNWDINKWIRELKVLKEADMNYLILAPSVVDERNSLSKAIYPSKLRWIEKSEYDTIEACLSACESLDLKVFLGLNEDRHWWQMKEEDNDWFLGEMQRGNEIASEIYSRYKNRYPKTFFGWYFVWEFSSLHLKTSSYQIAFAQAFSLQLDFLSELDPTMPLMFCPYMVDTEKTPDEMYETWSTFFDHARLRPGDIFCPQDAVGAGWLKLDNFVEYFAACKKAANKVPGLLFWSDAETFCQETWTSTTMDRFLSQLKLSSNLVDNYVTFSYCHYFSPYIVPKGYHKAYLEYVRLGKLVKETVTPPNVEWTYKDGQIVLFWDRQNIDDICGYLIYQDGIFKKKLQPKPKRDSEFVLADSYKDTPSSKETSFSVVAYDYKGNKAVPVCVKVSI